MAKVPEKPAGEAPASTASDDLATELARRVGPLVPQPQRAQVIAQIVSAVQEERFAGPIAHPKHLREYEQIVPGSANRIIEMAEKELHHTQSLQEKAIQADIDDQREGRRLGFAALILLMIGALICGLMGHEILAGAFLGAGALGVVGNFIKGRSSAAS